MVPYASANRSPSGAGEPLRFAFWPVRPDIVARNLAHHARLTGDRVEAVPIDGPYEAALAELWAAGRGPHAFYAQRAEASLWAAEGRIAPLPEDDPVLASTLARMDPRFVAGARDESRRLLGLTYYNAGPFALIRNVRLVGDMDEANLAGWDDVLALCRRLRRAGVAHPFVPRWHETQTGLVWSLLSHLATEGCLDLEEAGAETALARVLALWSALLAEDLVPPESLSDRGDAPAVVRWRAGRHALTFTIDYLLADFAAGEDLFSQPMAHLPGPTGTPLLPGHALLCVAAGLSPNQSARALRLVRTMGGEDPTGDLFVHRRWLSECLFPVPFPELDDDPGIDATTRRFFPDEAAAEALARLRAARCRAVSSPITHRPWMLAWSAGVDAIVRREVLSARNFSPREGAGAILTLWRRLTRSAR